MWKKKMILAVCTMKKICRKKKPKIKKNEKKLSTRKNVYNLGKIELSTELSTLST